MSEFKGTPGPWRVEHTDYHNGTLVEVVAAVDGIVAWPDVPKSAAGWKRQGHSNDTADVELKANARLIAAAPELLEALQAIVGQCYDEDDEHSDEHLRYVCMECNGDALDAGSHVEHDDDCLTGKAEAAIAKALGEEVKA